MKPEPHGRGHCVHFNGSHNKACNAGVDYHEAFGHEDGTMLRAPCIQEYKSHEKVGGKYVPIWRPWDRKGRAVIVCQKLRLPTPEEIAADEAAWQAVIQRMTVVTPVVSAWRTWTKKNRVAKAEVIDCPTKCGGKLHLSQSAHNGHVWGKCTTEGCVSWME